MYRHLPTQRQLSAATTAKAAKLLEMKANKKLIQQELVKETGNIILLKDLSNIASRVKQGKSHNDIDATVKTLRDTHGEIICNVCT